jgi:hypothetical protein
MDVANVGKVLIGVGLGTVVLGLLLWGVSAVAPGLKLGRLPGDIVIDQPGTKVFIPITTMLLVSAVLTLVFWSVSALRR